jgi:hypothetical protein
MGGWRGGVIWAKMQKCKMDGLRNGLEDMQGVSKSWCGCGTGVLTIVLKVWKGGMGGWRGGNDFCQNAKMRWAQMGYG